MYFTFVVFGKAISVNVVTFAFPSIPSSPFVFLPVPYTFLSMSFTIVSFPEAEMSVIPSAIFPTTKLFVVFPVPNCPLSFLPHVYSFPFCPSTDTCPEPIDADIPLFITVFTGVLFEVVLPFPNSPLVPFPHTKTHPNSFIAVLPFSPADISTILFKLDDPPSPTTFLAYPSWADTGPAPTLSGLSFVPIPSCPFSFLPHAYTSPLLVNANTWFAPADILIISVRYSVSDIFTCCIDLSFAFIFIILSKLLFSTFVVFSFIVFSSSTRPPIHVSRISLFPVIHTVPSAFNIAVNPFPVSTCGTAISFDTFIMHITFTFSYSLCFP